MYVLSIPEENWTLSSIITKDIYCVADGLTGFIGSPIYYPLLIGKEPACVLVNRNRFVDVYRRVSLGLRPSFNMQLYDTAHLDIRIIAEVIVFTGV